MVSGESSVLNISQGFIVPLYIYEIHGFRYPEPFSRFPELLQENTEFVNFNYPTVTSFYTFPNSLFNNNAIIWCYIIFINENDIK